MAALSTYWSPSDLQTLRQSLIDQQRFLFEQRNAAMRLRDADPLIESAIAAGSDTQQGARHEQQLDKVDTRLTQLGGELVAVEGALNRLYRGVFGVCIHCHQDIAAARLRAQPAAVHCLSCHNRAHEGAPTP